MRRIMLLVLAALWLACGTAFSAGFPAKATYLFFIKGVPAGRSDIECTTEGGAYVFRSTSKVTIGQITDSLTCRTEFDQKTLRPRLFQYKGVLSGEQASGTIRIDADSAVSSTVKAGYPLSARLKWTDPTLIFQNFTPEHLVVLSRFLTASDAITRRFTVLFPADMMFVPTVSEVASELEIPTRPVPSICKKFGISIQSSFPFYMYVDPKQSLPVYMDFLGVQTEMFLQSAFGDHPPTKYAPSGGGATQQ